MVEQSSTSSDIQSARRPQFTLRALLLGTTAAALLFALMAYRGWLGAFFFVLLCLIGFSIASFRQGQRKRSLGILFVALLIGGLVAPVAPATHFHRWESHICTHCGLLRRIDKEGPIGDEPSVLSKKTFPTDFSKWHQDHFGACSKHKWHLNYVSSTFMADICGLRWKTGASSFVANRLPSPMLSDDQRKHLDELFAQDKAACKKAFSEMLQ